MACTAMTNGFYFDTIWLHGEEEADKIRSGLGGWACGGRGCFEWHLIDEELKVLEKEEMVVGI